MRLVRLGVAGIVLGAVGGYVGALLFPRTVHRSIVADAASPDPATLPEHLDGVPLTELPSPAEAHR